MKNTNEIVIATIKAQAFDAIVKMAKGTKEDATMLLAMIQNFDTMVTFTEKAQSEDNDSK